ncbi:MAG TPA: hypothetical protein DIW77_09810 [Chromatiaceae bacterium]|nr:hypothetical protein [Chromatiaceae bacterium]
MNKRTPERTKGHQKKNKRTQNKSTEQKDTRTKGHPLEGCMNLTDNLMPNLQLTKPKVAAPALA